MPILTLLMTLACQTPPADPPAEVLSEPTTAGGVPLSQVMERMGESTIRLSQTPGGGQLMNIIHAHGGFEPWFTPGTIAFDFDYQTESQSDKRRYTRSRVDLWSSRAVQEELGEGADARLGWDGQQSWIVPDRAAFPAPPRFWATTPYYFVAIPWVLGDPGVSVAAKPAEMVQDPELGERELGVLEISFEANTGDSPDDRYVIYYDLQTNLVEAVRYTVTYEGFHPDGGQSPAKILFYRQREEVSGLLLATHYDGYAWNDGEPVERVSTVDVAGIELGVPLSDADFAPPEGAVVSGELDGR
ncbi:MAG: hypothetical protein ACI8S6_004858 [Myxococcota bacterium]|jgi:hypothetical protein